MSSNESSHELNGFTVLLVAFGKGTGTAWAKHPLAGFLFSSKVMGMVLYNANASLSDRQAAARQAGTYDTRWETGKHPMSTVT